MAARKIECTAKELDASNMIVDKRQKRGAFVVAVGQLLGIPQQVNQIKSDPDMWKIIEKLLRDAKSNADMEFLSLVYERDQFDTLTHLPAESKKLGAIAALPCTSQEMWIFHQTLATLGYKCKKDPLNVGEMWSAVRSTKAKAKAKKAPQP